MAERIEGARGQNVTVAHLTTSLSHIETWCRAVREALDSIPDKESIRFPENFGSEPLVARQQLFNPGSCEPPEPRERPKPPKPEEPESEEREQPKPEETGQP